MLLTSASQLIAHLGLPLLHGIEHELLTFLSLHNLAPAALVIPPAAEMLLLLCQHSLTALPSHFGLDSQRDLGT